MANTKTRGRKKKEDVVIVEASAPPPELDAEDLEPELEPEPPPEPEPEPELPPAAAAAIKEVEESVVERPREYDDGIIELQPRRGKKPARSVNKLAKLLPDAEMIKLYKREDLGKRAFICVWKPSDILKYGDIEVMIQQHIVPHNGPGDYEIEALNARGDIVRTMPVNMGGPKPATADSPDSMKTAQTMIEKLFDRLDRIEREKGKTPSVAEQIEEFRRLQQALGMNQKGADPAALMQAMLMFMQKQAPTTNEETILLRQELRRVQDLVDKSSKDDSKMLAALPPLPPPEKKESVAEIMNLMLAQSQKQMDTLIQIFTSGNKGPNPEVAALQASIQSMQTSMASMRDEYERKLSDERHRNELELLKQHFTQTLAETRAMHERSMAEMRQILEAKGTGGVREVFEQAAEIIQYSERIVGPRGGGETTFWGFMNNLISNSGELGGALERITRAVKDTESRELTEGEEHEDEPDEENAIEHQPQPQDNAIPKAVVESMAKINDTDKDEDRIRILITSLFELGRTQRWAPTIKKLGKDIQDDKKTAVMGEITSFVRAFEKNGILQKDSAEATLAAVDKHYEDIRDNLVPLLEKLPK